MSASKKLESWATTKTVLPEIRRAPAEEAISAHTMTTFSGTGITKQDLNEIGARNTLEVSEEVSTEKRIDQIRKKRKDGWDKQTLIFKQLKMKGK